jgi:hypothetical protein
MPSQTSDQQNRKRSPPQRRDANGYPSAPQGIADMPRRRSNSSSKLHLSSTRASVPSQAIPNVPDPLVIPFAEFTHGGPTLPAEGFHPRRVLIQKGHGWGRPPNAA